MFLKNINALKLKNIDLAKRLEQVTMEEATKVVSAAKATSGDFIIAYNNIALEDTNNPIQNAKLVWENSIKQDLYSNDFVFVFGLGLGYLFKRAYISCPSRIFLYEPNIEVLRFVFEYVDLASEISDNRVFVFDREDDCLEWLKEKYISKDKIEFLLSDQYIKLFSEKIICITEEIVKLCEEKNVDVTTIKRLSKYWVENGFRNLTSMSNMRPLNLLKNKFKGKTALIIAAGPSLKDNIELIKQNAHKYVVFAVNKISDYLLENDVVPDFLVASDAHFLKFLIKVDDDYFSKINFIGTSKTDYFMFRQNFKSRFIAFLKNDSSFQELSAKYPEEITLYETEGAVISQCYYSALEMGFEKMIFVGMDFALKSKEAYAMDVDMKEAENGKVKIMHELRELKPVKSVTGGEVFTRDDYSIFIRQLERAFLNSPEVIKYNTTNFGAYIGGMFNKPLGEVFGQILSDKPDVDGVISSVYDSLGDKWQEIINCQKNILKPKLDLAREIRTKITSWLGKNSRDIELLNESVLAANKNKYLNIKREEILILNDIVSDDLIASYFQAELLDITESNKDETRFIEARKITYNIFQEMIPHFTEIIGQLIAAIG